MSWGWETTHRMCPVCFAVTPIEDLFVDHLDQKWDLCSEQCARDAGWTGDGWAHQRTAEPERKHLPVNCWCGQSWDLREGRS